MAFLLHFCDQKQQSRVQIPKIWRTMYVLLTLAPTSCVQAAPGAREQLSAIGLG